MKEHPSWQYDEMKQIGKDYSDLEEVKAYDARHGKFRDIAKENEGILESICIKPEHVIIEIGTGTGNFAIQAAPRCSRVYAVDISHAMLELAKTKAERAGITNVKFWHGGFLTYIHADQPVDAIITSTALHHLPDFWKGIALQRMNRMLKKGGRLYISDVVFVHEGFHANIERWISQLEAAGGSDIRKDIDMHIRQEYSTFDWIMEGLLERASFTIDNKEMQGGVIARYLCSKEADCG